jgi:hypothetical protein
MTPSYPDRRERRFRELDFRRGCRVKVVSQRKTAAVDLCLPKIPFRDFHQCNIVTFAQNLPQYQFARDTT